MDIDDKFCIICYEKVGLLKYNTICSCKFYYHLDCYLEWNNVNPICLICRNPITQSQILETINPLVNYSHLIARNTPSQNNVQNFSIQNNSNLSENDLSEEDNSEILTAKTCVIFILIFSCIFLLVLCSTILFFNN